MDESLLVLLSAIATGAAAGTSDAARDAVGDAYRQLKDVLRRENRDGPGAPDPLTEYEKAVAAAQDRLAERLTELGEPSPQVRARAAELMAAAARKAEYYVHAVGSQGIVTGSNTTVHMTFGAAPGARDDSTASD